MGSPVVFVLYLFCLVHNVRADENGIVGFGISLYQDLCCQACHDSLSSLYLNCTTFSDDMDMGSDMDMSGDMSMMGTTSDECYASNTPWLQTMAYCIQQNCNSDGYNTENQAKCFSVQAVAGASTPTFQDSLPATAPTEELSGDAMWLNVTSLVNSDTYYATHGTLGEFARQEYFHTRYSVILYLVTIGIIIVCGILAQARSILSGFQKSQSTSNLWAKLQQYIFLPALLGDRRLEPLPGNAGYVPGRALSIFISIFVILNVVFSAVNFRSFWPNTWFASPQFELCEYVGNRTGTLSLVNMSIAILFAGRNNLLIALTGWSQTTFLTLHRWAARVGAVQAVVHSIVYTLAYFEPGRTGASDYAAMAAQSFYWWGIIATIAFCLAIAFAILPIRTRFYEIFLVTHIVLVILLLIGCWYHLVPHFGFVYGYQVWLYIAFAFWSFDRLARFVRVLYYNRFGNTAAIAQLVPGCDVIQVTIFPQVDWNFGPGQHTFLYLPGLHRPWQSHPFSIAGWRRQGELIPTVATLPPPVNVGEEKVKGSDITASSFEIHPQQDTTANKQQHKIQNLPRIQGCTEIRLLMRVHKGVTSALQRQLLSTPSGHNADLSGYIEGPYAGHRASLQPLLAADTVVCIIGGIGITNALGFIQEYARAHGNAQDVETSAKSRGIMRKAKRFVLAWSAREKALIEYVKRSFLAPHGDVAGIEYSFWCTGTPDPASQKLGTPNDEQNSGIETSEIGQKVTMGRMHVGSVIRSVMETGFQTTVLVCGPGSMADEATREVINCVKDGFKVDLVEEAFAW